MTSHLRPRLRSSVAVTTTALVVVAALAACKPASGQPDAAPSASGAASADHPASHAPGHAHPAPSVSAPTSATPSGAASAAPTGPSAPHHNGAGVAFDPRRIPVGVPGSGQERIRRTGEMPDRTDDIGAFRTVCQYSHMNTDDAIVFPGQPGASHLHVYWGNTGANAASTAESLARTGNSTCRGGIVNRSAYWAPAVIDTRTGTPIAPELIHVYYKSGYMGVAPELINPMPRGLRMVAGDPQASAPQASAPQDFTRRWSCHNAGTVSRSIPACQVGDHVTMSLDFPQCWDGRNLDSADHKSHMAYADGRSGCPATHPVAIPVISFNVLYPVSASTDTSGWRLSSDTYDASRPGGYSIHGDWFDGWNEEIKNTWIAGCVRRSVSCGSHMLGDGRIMDGDR